METAADDDTLVGLWILTFEGLQHHILCILLLGTNGIIFVSLPIPLKCEFLVKGVIFQSFCSSSA